jgi:hypothetical protein
VGISPGLNLNSASPFEAEDTTPYTAAKAAVQTNLNGLDSRLRGYRIRSRKLCGYYQMIAVNHK